MPTINIDDKIRDQIKEIAEESKCSIKGVIYLLLKNKPKAFKQSEVDFCNRLYPTREVLSNNWDSFWTILTSYINSHPDSHYKAKELAEIASCSELQMQSLIDLLVLEKYIKVGGPGYIKCRKGNINLTLKEARSTSYDHRANDIIDLLEKNPEGLTSKDLEDRLNLTRSQVKGSAKNPLVKNRVLIKDDLWILSETPLKKTIKKPIKKPLKRVIKRHKTQ